MDARQGQTIHFTKVFNVVDFLRNKIALSATDSQRLITVLLALTAFSLAVSVSLKSVFMTLTSVTIIANIFIYQRREIMNIFIAPWFIAAMLFFFIILIGCLISPADKHTQLDFLHKYSKLFYLPLLAIGFQDKQSRFWGIQGFLLGMFVTLVVSVYKVFVLGQVGDTAAVFYNHIVTGYFMAFAAFIASIYVVQSQGKMRLIYIALALLFSVYTLFVNTGRTGYIMLAILLLLVLFTSMRRKLLSSLLMIIPLLFLVYHNPQIKQGMGKILSEAQQYQHGQQDTSVGYRLQFHQYAQNLFLRSPVIGVGTGALSYYFSVEKPVPTWRSTSQENTLMEPHGEYWLVAAEHGVLGLAVFAFFIITLFSELHYMHEMRPVCIGLLVTFFIGCGSEGFLLLTGPGYLLVVFVAMGLGEAFVAKQDKLAKRYILNREY